MGGQDTDGVSTFLVFLTSHFAPAAPSSDLTNLGPLMTMKIRLETFKNHGNPPKTIKNHETTLKIMETKQKPWNHLEKPWKPTKNHETTLTNHLNQAKTMKNPETTLKNHGNQPKNHEKP